jgi:hypothetical protein
LRSHLAISGASFNLDFHAVPFFGEDDFVERHYLPRRSHRDKAVLTFIAQDAGSDVLCYANADLRKGEESDEVLRFVDFWKKVHGKVPPLLVFDSKLTTYKNLARLDAMGITFITLRRRSPGLKLHMQQAPLGAWRRVELDVPGRKFRTPSVLDEKVRIKDYPKPLRQLCVRDFGHEEPTIVLTNDMHSVPSTLLARYARRMLIENNLEDQVHFFHGIRSAAPVRKRTAAGPADGPAPPTSGAGGLRGLRRRGLAQRAGRRHRQRAQGQGQLRRVQQSPGRAPELWGELEHSILRPHREHTEQVPQIPFRIKLMKLA